LTKMAHFAACKTTITADQTTKLFLTNTVWLHGIPSSIISDRDPRFTSNFWTKTWQQFGTRLHLSTAYHPQSDGQTERTNQTMEQLIRTTCTDYSAVTKILFHEHEFAYNNAPSATTTQSPFFLNYGIDPTTPLSTPIENLAPRSQQFVENLRQSQQKAADAILKANQRAKQQADRRCRDLTLAPGQLVLLDTRNLAIPLPNKLPPRFCGPFRIIRMGVGETKGVQDMQGVRETKGIEDMVRVRETKGGHVVHGARGGLRARGRQGAEGIEAHGMEGVRKAEQVREVQSTWETQEVLDLQGSSGFGEGKSGSSLPTGFPAACAYNARDLVEVAAAGANMEEAESRKPPPSGHSIDDLVTMLPGVIPDIRSNGFPDISVATAEPEDLDLARVILRQIEQQERSMAGGKGGEGGSGSGLGIGAGSEAVVGTAEQQHFPAEQNQRMHDRLDRSSSPPKDLSSRIAVAAALAIAIASSRPNSTSGSRGEGEGGTAQNQAVITAAAAASARQSIRDAAAAPSSVSYLAGGAAASAVDLASLGQAGEECGNKQHHDVFALLGGGDTVSISDFMQDGHDR
ncbi:hypothetical protein CLOM_g22977, partial [Closterium sp. NIES-68]